METMEKAKKFSGRLSFLDFARGIIMIIMAWDHVSGFWNQYHHGGEGILGRAPPFINTTWFLLRFVSHYCAPTFIFLAGTVLAISATRRLERGDTERDVTLHLITRGLVLLVLEAALVSPAFSLPWTYFGVIACIGVSFIIFSVARKLPPKVILLVSLLIVLNEPFLNLDFIPLNVNWGRYLRVIINEPNFERFPYFGLYPIIPWIGVMGMGWSLGSYLESKSRKDIADLRNRILATGIASIVMFFVVRYINGYGNLLPRTGNTLMEWLYVSKYPPSLAFLLWSLGGMCIFLTIGLVIEERELSENRLVAAILTIGRNPLFFYVTHLWLYRIRWTGPPYQLELSTTLVFWAVGIVVLWFMCREYEKLKRKHPKPILQYI
jgi:uncharacterized membrane protein